MKPTIFHVLTAIAVVTACSPKDDRPIIQEYRALMARHDSSYHEHGDVDRRHDDLEGYHQQLRDFISNEQEQDTTMLKILERHERFFLINDSLMQRHAAVMQQHEDFKARFVAGKVNDDELRPMIDQMRAEHDQMDADHAYVRAETRKLRTEHNELRKHYNELRAKAKR